MSEIDYIVPKLLAKQDAIINIDELYSLIKEWFFQRGYFLMEKEHHSKEIDEDKDMLIKFTGEKKVDDYTKFVIKIKIIGSNVKEVSLKKKRAFKGPISVKLESFLKKDYEDVWEVRPLPKFFRGLYDKFVLKDKFAQYSEDLKKETYLFYNEVKAFLNLHKF